MPALLSCPASSSFSEECWLGVWVGASENGKTSPSTASVPLWGGSLGPAPCNSRSHCVAPAEGTPDVVAQIQRLSDTLWSAGYYTHSATMTLQGTFKKNCFYFTVPGRLDSWFQLFLPSFPALNFTLASFARRLCSAPTGVGAELPPTPHPRVWPHRECPSVPAPWASGVLPSTGSGVGLARLLVSEGDTWFWKSPADLTDR